MLARGHLFRVLRQVRSAIHATQGHGRHQGQQCAIHAMLVLGRHFLVRR